jgi:hypothetical protein
MSLALHSNSGALGRINRCIALFPTQNIFPRDPYLVERCLSAEHGHPPIFARAHAALSYVAIPRPLAVVPALCVLKCGAAVRLLDVALDPHVDLVPVLIVVLRAVRPAGVAIRSQEAYPHVAVILDRCVSSLEIR